MRALRDRGHAVETLVRRPAAANEHQWAPQRGELDPSVLSGVDVIVNLNGRNISEGRWSAAVKHELRSSRLDSTQTLVAAIRAADRPPQVLVNASATGYYGDRGDEPLDETTASGDGFLAALCADWEAAAAAAEPAGTRVVMLRLGMVLDAGGGALSKMLTPFKLGFGGPIGNGRQYWPWIAMDDVIGAVFHLLADEAVSGPVNLVAPEPVTSRAFARTLGEQLGRPAIVPAPAFAVKLALGEMAEALLLASTRAVPAVLERTGYAFAAPTLATALRQLLG